MKSLTAIFCFFALAVSGLSNLFAAEVMPPAPKNYFNDYAHVVSPQTADALNAKLRTFEQQTSNQIVVAIFPKMQSDSSVEDYTVRIAQSWRGWQKGLDNGAVLFVFVQDHKMFIQTGYGLEGALPDITCKRIIDNDIAPRFKAGDYDGGLTAGVDAIIAATKGEYKGTGTTVAQRHGEHDQNWFNIIFFLIFLSFFILPLLRRRGTAYHGSGWSNFAGGFFLGGGGFGGGGGGFSGGDGFMGGGGSSGGFGGGGAGGSW